MERKIVESGGKLRGMSADDMEAVWQQIKGSGSRG
jgi:hypothetical protein